MATSSACCAAAISVRKTVILATRLAVKMIRGWLTLWAVIIWERHITIESNADGPALLGLEFLTVQLARVGVRKDQVVPDARSMPRRSSHRPEHHTWH